MGFGTFRLFDVGTYGLWKDSLTFGVWEVWDVETFRVLDFGTLRPRNFWTFYFWTLGLGTLGLFGLFDV